ncbi:hypothetical protein N0V83_001423 [Neocucurbitaria cava]|uniref:Uncharacterized protein n=1 Tax=Neocucurbitaria cava TaxID=798079 RepID=A0A9W8YFJ6_9PLEO|nr:hypothetical protein N0V83_001423 [Neocucurbitaria cava]
MVSKVFVIAAAVAYVEARFGQEQVPISAISAVQGGAPGAAATVAGAAISDLLGGANSCAKLTRADQVFSELGGGADALAAAIGLVTAEKNTNPFANDNVQNVCGDASLPATPELRGITPLIDPAVDVDGKVAALSKSSAASPLAADGLSVFDLLDQAGLGSLVVSQAAAGGAAAGNANQQASSSNNNTQQAASSTQAAASQQTAAADDNADACDDSNANADAAASNNDQQAAAPAAAANNTNVAAGVQASSIAGLDFGKCTPTITFQGGEGNRPATEFTFQIADTVARGGQGEALNPNIITNALCNQLTNVCDANDAAKAACLDAKAQVAAAGTRDKSTADLFNTALGFAGAVTNPAGGPADPPAAAAQSGRKMRRGLRAAL